MPDSERDRVVAEIGPSREMRCLILGNTILPADDEKGGQRRTNRRAGC